MLFLPNIYTIICIIFLIEINPHLLTCSTSIKETISVAQKFKISRKEKIMDIEIKILLYQLLLNIIWAMLFYMGQREPVKKPMK